MAGIGVRRWTALVSTRRAKVRRSAEIRHDTEVTPEPDVTDEDKADPTPDEASAIDLGRQRLRQRLQSEGSVKERASGGDSKATGHPRTDRPAHPLYYDRADRGGQNHRRVARFVAGTVRAMWRALQTVLVAVQGAAVAAMLILLGIVGAISVRNPLGLVLHCRGYPGLREHSRGAGAPLVRRFQHHRAATCDGSAEASTAALQRSVNYVDNKPLALALTSMGTDHHQQAVVALFRPRLVVELTLGTEQDSPNYDVALRADDYASNPRSRADRTRQTTLRESTASSP